MTSIFMECLRNAPAAYPLGIMIAAIIYAQIPAPPKQVRITHARRTRVGSISKYSAIPPHTPQSIQFTVDLYKRLLLIILSFFLIIIKLSAPSLPSFKPVSVFKAYIDLSHTALQIQFTDSSRILNILFTSKPAVTLASYRNITDAAFQAVIVILF